MFLFRSASFSRIGYGKSIGQWFHFLKLFLKSSLCPCQPNCQSGQHLCLSFSPVSSVPQAHPPASGPCYVHNACVFDIYAEHWGPLFMLQVTGDLLAWQHCQSLWKIWCKKEVWLPLRRFWFIWLFHDWSNFRGIFHSMLDKRKEIKRNPSLYPGRFCTSSYHDGVQRQLWGRRS